MIRGAALALAVALAPTLGACAGQPRDAGLAAATPAFDPATFFAGRSHGEGRLAVVFKSPVPVRVESVGRLEGETIVLDQRITEGDKPPRDRRWRLRPAGPARWTGTLTDASGPVTAETRGNRLHIAYPMKGGFDVEQWIYLQPGGRVALNRMAVGKLGVRVATLDETIRRD